MHYVYFTVQGRSASQVTLTDLRVRVVQRRPALPGTHVFAGCGGPTVFRWVSVDLDQKPPAAQTHYDRIFASDAPAQERRPIKFPYRVTLSEAETFAVVGNAKQCDCLWEVDLDWASEGRTGTYTIRSTSGQPFRTTGDARVYAVCGPSSPSPPVACR